MSIVNSQKRIELLTQIQTLAQMVSNETALFQQQIATRVDLNVTDLKALSILQRSPALPHQLVDELQLTSGAVTNLVDRLEKRGLVVRTPDSSDRRKVIVSLRSENIEPLAALYQSMGTAAAELYGSYSTEQLEFLVEHYARTIALTKQEIVKLQKEDLRKN